MNLLHAKGLFSNKKITDLLDPAHKANKSAVERHHLFSKKHLKKLGITQTRITNQIANYRADAASGSSNPAAAPINTAAK